MNRISHKCKRKRRCYRALEECSDFFLNDVRSSLDKNCVSYSDYLNKINTMIKILKQFLDGEINVYCCKIGRNIIYKQFIEYLDEGIFDIDDVFIKNNKDLNKKITTIDRYKTRLRCEYTTTK